MCSLFSERGRQSLHRGQRSAGSRPSRLPLSLSGSRCDHLKKADEFCYQCILGGTDRIVGPKGAKGLCSMHYRRLQKWGDPSFILKEKRRFGCDVDGCSNPHWGNGFCEEHYENNRQRGDPLRGPGCDSPSDIEQFLDRINVNGPLVTVGFGRCWIWTSTLSSGLPRFKGSTAKRWAYST